MKATHREIEQMVGMTKIILQPGQFVYGRHVASIECGLPSSTMRNCMNWLKDNQTLDIKPDNKKSVVTVVNWALYQSHDEEKDSTLDNNRTTTGQQQDTNKKVKKLKKDIYSENVALSEEEYQKLVAQFGDADTIKRIANLSYYKGSTGKKYASDYMTILNWARKEEKPKQTELGKDFWRGAL